MFTFIKYYFRYLLKNKTVSSVGFMGLTIAIAASTVIFIYYHFERNYDKFNENYSNIYRLRLETIHNGKQEYANYFVNPPSGATLKKAFPEIEDYVRISSFREAVFSYNNNFFEEKNAFFVDSSMFNVFSFHFLEGDKNKALTAPRTVVLTKSTAKRYFGNADPMGKEIKYGQNAIYQVTGVVDDLPENSHLKIDMLLSYNSRDNSVFRNHENRWDRYWVYTYLLVKDGTNIAQLEQKTNQLLNEHKPNEIVCTWVHTLQPMKDFHLYSQNDRVAVTGNGEVVKFIFFVAILILLIAYINQANISVAQSFDRIKTVALSHVVGGKARGNTVLQFIVESLMITVISFILGIILCLIFSPVFSMLFHFTFSLSILPLAQWGAYFIALLLVACITGVYPAFVILSQNINESLKSKVKQAGVSLIFRKGLIVLQYSITGCLIIGALVIYRQKEYMLNKDLGLNIENTIVIKGALLNVNDSVSRARIESFKEELLSHPQITDISSSNALPGNNNYADGTYSDIQQASDMVLHTYYQVDYDFITGYNIKLIAGRNFSKDFPSDVESASIINEKALATLGFRTPEEALGHVITRDFDKSKTKIIGVVKNFHTGTLSLEIPSLVMRLYPNEKRFYSVKFSGADPQSVLNIMEKEWQKTFPNDKFTYFILKDNYKDLYKGVENYGVILGLFSTLAIFLSCFGLFGLSFYTIVQRTKEIGIRKINGASIASVSGLLFSDFAKIILMSFVISCPIAYYLSHKWIEGFAYRVSLSWWIFALSGIISLGIAVLTVSWQSWKAATRNPVEALRYE
jgi:putative ABC transport system permease protein